MRKITQEAINAFIAGVNFNKSNTNVERSPLGEVVVLKLHGNAIARYSEGDYNNTLEVCDGGWSSNTTKERLNGLLGVSVNQKSFVWYLNGMEWNGNWTKVF